MDCRCGPILRRFARVCPVGKGARQPQYGPRATYCGRRFDAKEEQMLRWAMIFLVLALVAALFGFGGIASASAGIAKILFTIFLVVFAVMLLLGLAAGRKVVS